MRAGRVGFRASLLLAGFALGAGAVCAEPFFERLLGGPPPSLRSFGRSSPYGDGRHPPFYARPEPAPQSMLYRTVCVRLCDGYYWPVSGAATRARLHRDANTCKASCDSEARLFYLPHTSEDVAAMTDLSGRAYRHLPEAFAYRRGLSEGCACRPPPWSEAARARHDAYAALDGDGAEAVEAGSAIHDVRAHTAPPAAVRETWTGYPQSVPYGHATWGGTYWSRRAHPR